MTIPRSHRPFFFLIRSVSVVWSLSTFRVENVLEKKWKNPPFETVIWSLADQVKNLIEKKWAGLSDSDMVNGGLKW